MHTGHLLGFALRNNASKTVREIGLSTRRSSTDTLATEALADPMGRIGAGRAL